MICSTRISHGGLHLMQVGELDFLFILIIKLDVIHCAVSVRLGALIPENTVRMVEVNLCSAWGKLTLVATV